MQAVAQTETELQRGILDALRYHRLVAWVCRMNTGGVMRKGQMVRYGVKGMCDITGQLKTGQRLEVEVKRPGKRPSQEQVMFIAKVIGNGGVAGVACSVEDAFAIVEGR